MTTTKQQIREAGLRARRRLADRDRLSRQILARATALEAYRRSDCVMWYLGVRDEVQTMLAVGEALESNKRVVVPYCIGGGLRLFQLSSLSELGPGSYGIPEPRLDLRDDAGRQVDVGELDVMMVPGVAFDRRGGRVGYGKGYFDRLLGNRLPATVVVGLAFACQLFDEIPRESHDRSMDIVLTESATYTAR